MKETKTSRAAGRLDFISPRLTPRMVRARSGRGFAWVQKIRVGLPVLAVFLVILLFLWPVLRPGFIMKDIAANIPDLVINHLHYTGADSKSQPYTLSADQATRPSGLHGIYDMIRPQGDISLQNGAWVSGKSDRGRYDEIGKHLWLGGNVHIFHDKGFEFVTDDMQIDLNTHDAWGDKPALLQGGFGTVRGVGFLFLDGGNTVVFHGPATAILRLHDRPDSATPLGSVH